MSKLSEKIVASEMWCLFGMTLGSITMSYAHWLKMDTPGYAKTPKEYLKWLKGRQRV